MLFTVPNCCVSGPALEASEKRFQSLIENSVDGIAVLDADGLVSYVSPLLPAASWDLALKNMPEKA